MQKVVSILYLLLCMLSVNAQMSKISPYVRQAMVKNTTLSAVSGAKRFGASSDRTRMITAFVRTLDADALRRQGCYICAQWDDIVIAMIPINKLEDLASMPQVQRIEANKSCSITNDTTATITRAHEVWSLTPATSQEYVGKITGKGVVVGVMDIGFDLTHPTFYTADGQMYRIKQFWDQLDQTQGGEAVVGKTDSGNDTIYVGRQYIGREDLLAIRHSYDGSEQYHGTHTTGTATGSGWEGANPQGQGGRGLAYTGMAPDADICLVCNMAGDNADLVPDSLRYLYTSATDMLGFKYIFDYADKVGKPCVINFSEGAYDDLWESVLYTEVLSKMIGPGHILCASAGNEGTKKKYIHKEEGIDRKGGFISNTSYNMMRSKKPVKVQLSFYQDGSKVKIWDYDATELALYPDSMMVDTIIVGVDSFTVDMETYPSCYDETLFATDFWLRSINNASTNTNTVVSLVVVGSDNDIEVFGSSDSFAANSLDPTLTDFDNTHCILFPGALKDVICVGASAYRESVYSWYGTSVGYDYGTNGVRAKFSSIGPALNGQIKPDAMAPGCNVVSSMNSFQTNQYNNECYGTRKYDYDGRTYYWTYGNGTSMATPVVTGIVALWLQECPTLTPDQLRDVFAHTCTHYDESISWPNNYYGQGEIDAIAGLQYIQRIYTGVYEVQGSRFKAQGSNEVFSLDGRRITSIDGRHGVFIIGGKKIIR